jgi:hypothetical protein
MRTFIAVVNHSTLVTNQQAYNMTLLCEWQARYHAAPSYGLTPPVVHYLANENQAPPGSAVLGIFDNADQAGDLGWHTEGPNGIVYGRVFAEPVLQNGGNVLTDALSVASVLSHETLETLGDSSCNRWCDTGNNMAIAQELCDPVESDAYQLTVGGITGTVSNFVMPAWFDPQAPSVSHFDWLELTHAPFQVRPTGYIIQMVEGNVTQHFGEEYPDWRKQTKESELARTARRLEQGS